MSSPLVTVLTLCYNTGKYSLEALECVKKQTYSNIEHIIIDDHSSDNSVSLISDWISSNKYKCIFIRNTTNTGIPSVINKALEIANGKYFTWISDDLWDFDRIEKTVTLFEIMPDNVDVLFGMMNVIDEKGSTTGHTDPYNSLVLSGYPHFEKVFPSRKDTVIIKGDILKETLFWKCIIPAPSVTIKKDLYKKIGKYDESLSIEDMDCWFRTSKTSSFVYYPTILASYRIHSSNYTSGIKKEYIQNLIRILSRYSPKGDKVIKRAIKKHIREEAYRIALNLIRLNKINKSIHYFFYYYIPNIQLNTICIKEILLFHTKIIRTSFTRK